MSTRDSLGHGTRGRGGRCRGARAKSSSIGSMLPIVTSEIMGTSTIATEFRA